MTVYQNIPTPDLPDFNPIGRQGTDFLEIAPSILDISIAKLRWIFSVEVFIDGVDRRVNFAQLSVAAILWILVVHLLVPNLERIQHVGVRRATKWVET